MNQETSLAKIASVDHKSPQEQVVTNSTFVPFNSNISVHARDLIKAANGIVFKTTIKAGVLRKIFLDNLPDSARQRFNCRCCLDFLDQHGDMVVINPRTFATTSVLWSGEAIPEPFTAAVEAMAKAVEKADIDRVLYSDAGAAATFGSQTKGSFKHFYLFDLPIGKGRNSFVSATGNGGISTEEYKGLREMVLTYKAKSLELLANQFQNSQQLRGLDKYAARINWLWDLRATWDSQKDSRLKENMLWIASASAGIASLHMGAGGSVMREILDAANGNGDLAFAIKNFLVNTAPENHMRPTTAPSEGELETAKRIVETMGIERSFYRRAARFDELPTTWLPKAVKEPAAVVAEPSIFDGIKTKEAIKAAAEETPSRFNGGTMTLRTFEEDVLPTADKMTILIRGAKQYEFVSAATALHPDAPAILVYDTPEKPMPLSLFARGSGGSYPQVWDIQVTREIEIEVKGIVSITGDLACLADGKDGRLYVLEGCFPTEDTSSCLFPTLMKPELHAVRKFVEAFSTKNMMAGTKEGMLGIYFGVTSAPDLQITVTSGKSITVYRIDRTR